MSLEEIKVDESHTENIQEEEEKKNDTEKNYVAISPDGSVIVKFNPNYRNNQSCILIKKVDTESKEIIINNEFDKHVLEWSLAVSDINEDYCFIAISYIVGKDETRPKRDKTPNLTRSYYNRFYENFGPAILILLGIIFIIPFICIFPFFLYSFLHDLLFPSYDKRIFNNEVFDQVQLSTESKGKIKIFRFDPNHLNVKEADMFFSVSTYPSYGVVGFLPSKNKTILVCMNYIKIQTIFINNKKKGPFEMVEKGSFLLPENLFKELKSSQDAKRNWKYFLKSRYREFLMTDKNYNQQTQLIEIYNINTSQLVNVFYRNREKKGLNNENNEPEIDSDLFCLESEPGIFAISTDSDLFAYSYEDNIITIYLMENGLEVVSKEFDSVLKIKFLEFIEENKKLFIIGEDKNGDMEFHIWVLSGCLNDHFIIKHNTSILSNYHPDHTSNYDHTLAKANGTVVFLDDKKNVKILHKMINENTIEPIKSGSENLSNEKFKEFKDLICSIGEPDLDDDEATIINIACGLLVYLYNDRNDRKKSDKELVKKIITFIKTFIKNHPDHWKLMEIQYPLIALLICARSFFLIKFILFGNDSKVGNLHRPRSQYSSYPNYIESLNLSKSDNDLKLALSLCKDRDAVMLAYLLEYYSENSVSHIGWMINVTEILPELSKHKYANYVDLLYYKSCFGKMKYNFPNKRFKTVSFKQGLLEVYLPLAQLIPINFASLFTYSKYKKLRYDMSSDICMVPLPNFTTCPNKETDEEPKEIGKFKKFWSILKVYAKLLRKIFIPINPFWRNKQFSPFLQVEKYNSPFFYIPAMEAVINSKWNQSKTNWMIFLIKYFIYLILFSYLTQIYLNNEENYSKVAKIIMTTIFYYLGIDLFIIEFMRIKKNFSMLHTFDLCSTILSITNLTLIIFGIENDRIILLTSVVTLILWIEMLLWLRLFSGIAINIYIFGNILKIIIPFFAFMIVLTIGFGHSMFILFGSPSLVNLNPSIPTYTLNNGSENFTLTGTEPDNPFDTPLDAILSAYYWGSLNFGDYDYLPLKLLAFLANIILVLVLLNMIIALMNNTFEEAKGDGKIGLLMFRSELINDYERLYGADLHKSLQTSKYICFRRDSTLMKEWLSKSEEIGERKLYSWFDEGSSSK